MIRGYVRVDGTSRRPYVLGRLSIPSHDVAGDVDFLVDTGADGTLLAPADAIFLRLDLAQFPPGPSSTGIGGSVPTVYAQATVALGPVAYDLALRILAPRSPVQQRALGRIPSLLGRDILSHFALFFEDRTTRVLLLDPQEADGLSLP